MTAAICQALRHYSVAYSVTGAVSFLLKRRKLRVNEAETFVQS